MTQQIETQPEWQHQGQQPHPDALLHWAPCQRFFALSLEPADV